MGRFIKIVLLVASPFPHKIPILRLRHFYSIGRVKRSLVVAPFVVEGKDSNRCCSLAEKGFDWNYLSPQFLYSRRHHKRCE